VGEDQHQAARPLKPKTILIADDSVTIRRVVELSFFDTGIRVETAASGAEALDKIASLLPDLVIADVVMGEPSGYDVCRAVKTSAQPVPVLLLAGTFEPFEPERARACGADGCLVKPFDSRTLIAHVERLLAAHDAEREPVVAVSEGESGTPDAPGSDSELENVFDDLAAFHQGDRPADAQTESLPERFRTGAADLEPVEEPGADWPAEPEAPSDAPPTDVPDATPDAVEVGYEPDDAAVSPSVPSEEGTAHPLPDGGPKPAYPAAIQLGDEEIERIARAVVARLTDRVLREIAWDVVPDLAERIIRERIRVIEAQEDEVS